MIIIYSKGWFLGYVDWVEMLVMEVWNNNWLENRWILLFWSIKEWNINWNFVGLRDFLVRDWKNYI